MGELPQHTDRKPALGRFNDKKIEFKVCQSCFWGSCYYKNCPYENKIDYITKFDEDDDRMPKFSTVHRFDTNKKTRVAYFHRGCAKCNVCDKKLWDHETDFWSEDENCKKVFRSVRQEEHFTVAK